MSRSVTVGAVAFACLLPLWAQEAAKPAPQLTFGERLAAWKGEKITILGDKPPGCSGGSQDGAPFVVFEPGDTKRSKRISLRRYTGRTGVIESTKGTASYNTELEIQLDGAEKIVVAASGGLGFHSELEAARKLAGKSWWARRRVNLRAGELCGERSAEVELRGLQKATIVGAEFGTGAQPLYLKFKTEDGKEAIFDGYSGHAQLDPKFHFDSKDFSSEFYFTDPREKGKTWTPNIWKLIENGEVAIGMTTAQAEMACGEEMRKIGFIITGATTAIMFQCHQWRFVIDGGKVTKYVER